MLYLICILILIVLLVYYMFFSSYRNNKYYLFKFKLHKDLYIVKYWITWIIIYMLFNEFKTIRNITVVLFITCISIDNDWWIIHKIMKKKKYFTI